MTPLALNQYLQRCDLSHEEFALILGVTKGAVAHWLSGRRDVPELVVRLIDYFDVNIRDFSEEL